MAKIEGRNPVVEALRGQRRIDKLLIQKGVSGDRIDWIIEEARKRKIRVERTSKNSLDKIAQSHAHQGVIAIAAALERVASSEMIELARNLGEEPLIIILDQIQDPHNFGSIIRTAYSAGAHGVIFQNKRAAGITPIVTKTSAGAVEHIMLSEVSNINQTIDQLKEDGLWIAGADIEGATTHYQTDLKGPLGIVIGNEGSGLRRLVKEKCDFLLRIPMKGNLGSLNASVAAGVIIYEALRQRS